MSDEKTKRYLLVAALAYLAFVIYGSLVPLQFKPIPLAEAMARFREIPYLSLGIASRSDWVANILLFIPLAFLLNSCLDRGRSSVFRLVSTMVVLTFCVGLSIGIEFTQLFFPQRTVSINDIIAESIGAVVGITAWWLSGPRLVRWLEGWTAVHKPANRAERILWLYLSGLFVYNLLPLDLIISPVELFHKWRQGRIILIPFTSLGLMDIKSVYGALADIAIWIPVTTLLLLSKKRTAKEAWLWTILACTLLELLQLFVWTRVTNVNQILESVIAGGLGVLLAGRFTPASRQESGSIHQACLNQSAWFWLSCFVVWSLFVGALFLYPFNFTTERSFLLDRLVLLKRVPFYAYYYGTEYRAATELLHRIVFFVPVGGFLAVAFREWRVPSLSRRFLTMTLCGIVIVSIEMGRIFLPTKNIDLIDPVLEFAGALLGYGLVHYLIGRKTSHSMDKRQDKGRSPVQPVISAERGRPAHEKDSPSQANGWWYIASGPALLMLAGIIAMNSPAIPYNVRKLFGGGHPFIALTGLVMVLYLAGGMPVLLKRWLAKGSILRVTGFPLITALLGAVVYFLLRMSVPVEMIHKIVGSPVMSWPGEWEPLGRFVALFSVPTIILTGGMLVVPLRGEGLRTLRQTALRWLAVTMFVLPFAHWVVVSRACTDNLTELMAGGGGLFQSILLCGWIFTLAQAGTVLSAYFSGYFRSGFASVLLIVILSIPLGYCFLFVGTEGDIYKYDQHFSALQFILSPDRKHYVGEMALLLRYLLAHIFVVVTIGISQFPFMRALELIGVRGRMRESR